MNTQNLHPPVASDGAPPEAADILVIGAGIMGLAFAYYAAALGQKRIVVVDRSYLCSGASGRNGGGVRMQWSTEDNVRLMQQSVELCRRFAAEMGVNVWFRQGGYLFLVKDPKLLPVLEANVALQNACGVPTRILTPKEAQRHVPALNLEGVHAASYNPKDGVLFPWPFLFGYAARGQELGVSIHTHAEVEALDVENGRITSACVRSTLDDWEHVQPASNLSFQPPRRAVRETGDAREDLGRARWRTNIRVNHVVNATGAWSPEIGRMVGLDLPNRPVRHEILTTEPLKPFLDPMVTVLGAGIYFSQSMRGEIVGGMGNPAEGTSYDTSSSLAFLRRFARTATSLYPPLSTVQVVRQWAGLYDVSPDGRPIIGESRQISNMTLLSGFTGHGFMMGPIIGKLAAERIVRGRRVTYFDQHPLERFEAGLGTNRETMIIG